MMNPSEALKKYFGYTSFRPGQEEIIKAILSGENVLAVLPTGAGKSICYQIPALVASNFSIVISPLIALMKDQVDSLNKQGEIAAFINSTLDFSQTESVLQKILSGKIKLLYAAPERLENISFAERIRSLKPSYVFVDEAHCISEWGHNFRPSYRNISEFTNFISVKKISAFTATATPEVVKDIIAQLNFTNEKVFVRGFERENLRLNVMMTKKKKEACLSLIKQYKTPAIIYTTSRRSAEEAAEYLNLHRINATYYHAGLAAELRKKIQEDFLSDKVPVIVATNAFGMGIDKKDIRLIIHYNTPGSIENYYQEIGRAGRDGKESFAFLLHHDQDIRIQDYFLANSYPDKTLIKNVYNAICDFGKIAEGNKSTDGIPVDLEFISKYSKREPNRGLLLSALRILESAGYIQLISDYERKSDIQIIMEKEKLKEFIRTCPLNVIKDMLLTMLREFGSDIYFNRIKISQTDLNRIFLMSDNDVDEKLTSMHNMGILEYKKSISKDNVNITAPRVNSEHLKIDYKKLNESYLLGQKKIDSMIQYALSYECRFKFILNYFGENRSEYKCGKCDKCSSGASLSEETTAYLEEIMLQTVLEKPEGLTQSELIKVIRGTTQKIENKKISTHGSCSNYDVGELKKIFFNLLAKGKIIRGELNSRIFFISNTARNELQIALWEEDKKSYNYEEDLELYHLLRDVRTTASQRFMQSSYLICSDEILRKIVLAKPKSESELISINGFNSRMFNKVGKEFLTVINKFLDEQKEISKETKNIPSSIKETYQLVKKGFKLNEIASLRKLSEEVISMQIETMLEYEPQMEIENLMDKKIAELIMKEVNTGYSNLKDLKTKLPSQVTYAMIRICIAKNKATSPKPASFYSQGK